ncbi:Hypothetical protein PHPALM_3152 [Phytophthora palmivora]|uniref:Uncharacterized protein n=1 Tax=Phytophthora palmivora TaxID=4796 RepID=A0A2P4YN36_9STRA|nr:Hypothetical protein PHPALM_3152 [Phytophthora palmivora]
MLSVWFKLPTLTWLPEYLILIDCLYVQSKLVKRICTESFTMFNTRQSCTMHDIVILQVVHSLPSMILIFLHRKGYCINIDRMCNIGCNCHVFGLNLRMRPLRSLQLLRCVPIFALVTSKGNKNSSHGELSPISSVAFAGSNIAGSGISLWFLIWYDSMLITNGLVGATDNITRRRKKRHYNLLVLAASEIERRKAASAAYSPPPLQSVEQYMSMHACLDSETHQNVIRVDDSQKFCSKLKVFEADGSKNQA